ncbi:MAG: endonuclease domain-containing protein, partial [Cyanobacteria bacterium CAN_BIN43]|nr:endonuclease domain-containing protein [Cyanobacteria bacterium CAN_BIN43]
LYIDIEIDEPYAYNTKEPTHFLGAWKDDNRNNFFLSKGWLVIRFSEEQVVRHPQSCCKTIAQAIAEVLGDNSVLNQFATMPNLQTMQQWTQSEAEDMAANDYRDRYLQQPRELADSPIEVEPHQVSMTSLPNTSRAQSRGAARKARRAALSTSLPKSNYIDEQVAIIKTGKKAHSSLLDDISAASRQGDREKMEEALLVLERVEKRGLNNVVHPGYTAKIRNSAEQEFKNKTV